MKTTMSPEMDVWLQRQRAVQSAENVRTVAASPSAPLTDEQFEWLWPRFQKCRFGCIGAAIRLSRTPLGNLTARGKAFAIRMAYRHRTQIFGRSARKFAQDEFLGAIRSAAAKKA